MSSAPTLKKVLGLAALGGLLQAAAHPPFDLWPLVFAAPLPLLLAVEAGRSRRNVAVGLTFGMTFWLPHLFWVHHVFGHYGGLAPAVSVLIWIGFALLMTTLDFVPLAWLHGRLLTRWPRGALFVFPVLWSAQEWFRGWHLSGFPWGWASHALTPAPWLLSPARLGGPLFLSALVVAVPSLGLAAIRGGRPRRAAITLLAAIPAILATGPLTRPSVDSTLQVLVIQTNVTPDLRWDLEKSAQIYRDVLDQTRTAGLAHRPDLIVWPESANPFSFDGSPRVEGDVLALVGELDAALILNTVRSEGTHFYNSARAIGPGPRISAADDKRHLVPFGEHVPLRRWTSWIGKIVRDIEDFTPGQGATPLPIHDAGGERLALAGVAICYEAVFPDVFRAHSAAGADVLVTVTNDGWYGGRGAEGQHWNGAVLAAVAEGKSLVRAAVTGISGVVDPSGFPLARLELGDKGELLVEVPIVTRRTLASRLGGGFGWLAAAVFLCAILAARRGAEGPDQ